MRPVHQLQMTSTVDAVAAHSRRFADWCDLAGTVAPAGRIDTGIAIYKAAASGFLCAVRRFDIFRLGCFDGHDDNLRFRRAHSKIFLENFFGVTAIEYGTITASG